MPKEITHWILAERALDSLDESCWPRRVIRSNFALYLAGAVLPDTLLHLFRGPWSGTALSLAHRFHDATGNSFAPLIRFVEEHDRILSDEQVACLLGVITHIVTDSVFHPFVYALGGTDDIGKHYRIETAIDVHFLNRVKQPPARRLDALAVSGDSRTLLEALAALFDPAGELPRTALERAWELHRRFQAMYDLAWWKAAATLLGAIIGAPFREQRQLFYPFRMSETALRTEVEGVRQWRHPVTVEMVTASVDELADETAGRITALFRRIHETGNIPDALRELPGANLLTGLHGAGMSAMKNTSKNGSTP